MDKDGIYTLVSKIKWYHTIDLGNGIITKGENNTPEFMKRIKLPDTLNNLEVLDIQYFPNFYLLSGWDIQLHAL